MTPAPPNPDRRNENSRRAILDATIELTSTMGYGKVTIERIAAAAGVGKQTIYRWWPSKAVLALEAINDYVGEATDFPDTGDIAKDLVAQMAGVIGLLNGNIGAVLRGTIAEAQSDPTIQAAIRDTIVEPRTDMCVIRLAKAVEAGQLRPVMPLREMVELIYAPVYYRLLLGTDELKPADASAFVANAMAGLAPAGG